MNATPRTLLVGVCAMLAGCGSSPPSSTVDGSAANPADAASSDAAALEDRGSPIDVPPRVDAVTPSDVPPLTDTVTIDRATSDAPTPVDRPTGVDTPTGVDAPVAVDLPSPSDGAVATASCQGRCGRQVLGAPCQCNTACSRFNDCCADYAALCVATCSDPSQTQCGTGCVDTRSTPAHCGGCNMACDDRGNQSVACAAGVCTRTCRPGYADCNGQAMDGCETDLSTDAANCGRCNAACGGGPFARASCSGGECALACDTGRASCNTSTVDGCETSLSTSATHCGACGVACPTLPNSTPSCAAGECRSACASPAFADCNGRLSDGCETNVGADARNCGACGRVCGPSETCVNSACSCTGAFTALTPPTPRNTTRLNERAFDYGLTCGIAPTSVATARVTVVGHGAGRQSGTFALVNPNLTRWTADAPLLGGDGFDITIGAGLRSVDNLRAAPYRVLQGRVATSSAGSGTFAAGWTTTGTTFGRGAALGDVNGDGHLDLITNEGLRLNNGSGSFGNLQGVVPTSAVRVWVHDFNADGFADVFVESSDVVPEPSRVLWGAATNPLRLRTDFSLPVGPSPGFGDIDGDGDIDIVVGRGGRSGGVTSVHRLDSTVSPGTFSVVGSVGPSDATFEVRLLDAEGDGDLDIFQGNFGLERILLNDGTGTFTLSPTTTGTDRTFVRGMAAGDINGDGFADLVMSHVVEFGSGTDSDQILLGNGSGGFTTAPGLNSQGPTELADVDGDGDLDVITRVGGRLGVYVNNGAGAFTGGALTFSSTVFAVGDIDADGDVDIVNVDGMTLTAYRNGCAGSTCTCGNRVLNGREQCDDGPMGSASCDTDCTLRACGDGVVNALAGEACDDGNTVDDDACRATCVAATCTDRLRNRDETDVDCGGACSTKCAGGQACRVGADCQSGSCYGFRCGVRYDFETGTFPPPGMSTSGATSWQLDAMWPIARSRRSVVSGQFPFSMSTAERTSSLFLSASYAVAGSIQFFRGTNTLAPNRLEFYIDGVRQASWAGQRFVTTDPDFGTTQFYNVAMGAHTFEWRFVYGPDSTSLPAMPRDRGWVDDIALIGGAPTP